MSPGLGLSDGVLVVDWTWFMGHGLPGVSRKGDVTFYPAQDLGSVVPAGASAVKWQTGLQTRLWVHRVQEGG